MMPEPGPAKSTGWWQRAALVAVVAGVAAVYFWTARSGSDEPMEFGRRQSDYYNLLVHGWLGGHLYMAVEPDPNLRIEHPNRILTPEATYLLDASYHQGHYYLYFGVTPVLLVMLPYSAITGADLPVSFVAALFATLGFALQVALLALLRRRFFPQSPPWLWLVVAATVGFANVLPATLRHPMFYEAAIAAGYAFVQAALLCLTLALLNPARAKRWLVLASLCAGLAAGARPNLILGPMLALPATVAWLWWRGAPTKRTVGRAGALLIAGGLPAALCVAALLWHNHARFGDALEFGINLQLGNPRGYACSSAYFWHNAKRYYLTPPELDWYFPFFPPAGKGRDPRATTAASN